MAHVTVHSGMPDRRHRVALGDGHQRPDLAPEPHPRPRPVGSAARPRHRLRPGRTARTGDPRAPRRRRRQRRPPVVRRPAPAAAREGRPRDVRPREAHARRRHERRVQAPSDPHPAERRLLLPARRGLPGPLPVLLPRRFAHGATDHPRLRRPAADPGRSGRGRRDGWRHVGDRGPRSRGHDVRGVLLHRPAGARARHRFPRRDGRALRDARLGGSRAAAPDDEVRRRRRTARPAPPRPHPRPGVRERRRGRTVRGRDGPRSGPVAGARPARPRGVPRRPDDRPDHARRRLADRVRRPPRRGRRGTPRRRRPHGRVHHPPVHAQEQGRPARLVPGDEARPRRVHAQPQAREVRCGEVRLRPRHHARAARVVRRGLAERLPAARYLYWT